MWRSLVAHLLWERGRSASDAGQVVPKSSFSPTVSVAVHPIFARPILESRQRGVSGPKLIETGWAQSAAVLRGY